MKESYYSKILPNLSQKKTGWLNQVKFPHQSAIPFQVCMPSVDRKARKVQCTLALVHTVIMCHSLWLELWRKVSHLLEHVSKTEIRVFYCIKKIMQPLWHNQKTSTFSPVKVQMSKCTSKFIAHCQQPWSAIKVLKCMTQTKITTATITQIQIN